MIAVREVSLGNKIKMVTGLAGTINVPAETSEFLEMVEAVTHDGRDLSRLSADEIKRIGQIWQEHFA